jgi:ribosomal-protein-alanine N-acetyltransferase
MLQVNFDTFPDLETSRLYLRQVNDDDTAAIFGLRSNSHVMAFLDRPAATSMADAAQLVKKINDSLELHEGITWGICCKSDPRLVGTIGLWQISKEHYRAELGYLLHPDYQGKGLMQEAIEAVLNYGFDVMQLHSVEANVNPLNNASIRLLERNNFIREAWFRENYYYNGKFLDTYVYSLLSNTYKADSTKY